MEILRKSDKIITLNANTKEIVTLHTVYDLI